MHITAASTLPELDALRDDWRRLHAQDANATAFASWAWLRTWAEVSPYPWEVLVARDKTRDGEGPIVGLFPISPRGSRAAHRIDQVREIHTMGDPSADFRGFICDAKREDAVIHAFAEHLAHADDWDRLVLKDVMDERLAAFITAMREGDSEIAIETQPGNVCPLLTLPETWDAYLAECLTPPSRKSLKKRLRIAEEHGCRLTTTSVDGEIARHVDSLLLLCEHRGKDGPEHLHRARRLLDSCLAERAAEVAVVWIGDEPAAAQGSFIDHTHGSIGHYLTGFDERFGDLSPGRVLDALCIRSAIERGYKAVDFLRGDEPYKHQLGARPRQTQHAFFTRHGVMRNVRATLSGLRSRLGG